MPTFGQVAGELIAAKRAGWRSKVHAEQWTATLETFCGPIWQSPVDQIDMTAVLSMLQPIWQRIPETARRLRGRIELVLDAAKVKGFRSGENPAAWKGNLAHLLPGKTKIEGKHHAAMPYQDVPAFVKDLRAIDTVPARALETLILTICRLREVLLAD